MLRKFKMKLKIKMRAAKRFLHKQLSNWADDIFQTIVDCD